MEEVNRMLRPAHTSYRKSEQEKYQHTNTGSVLREILKQQFKKGDAHAVLNYNRYIKSLLSLHKESSEMLNWEQFMHVPEPKLPVRQSLNQDIAEQEHRAYAPSVLDKILWQCTKKMNDLAKNTEQAKRYDDLIYNAALKEFKNDHQDWTNIQMITMGIRDADPSAFQHAIDFFNPFYVIIQLGAKVRCESLSEYITAHLDLQSTEMIPDFVVSQTATGKVIKSKMPASKFNDICHHHVCACALRIGREVFALLPVKCVYVNVYSDLPHQGGDNNGRKIIFSVKFTRAELLQLDFNILTAPDHVANFDHNIDFSLISGFSVAKPLTN